MNIQTIISIVMCLIFVGLVVYLIATKQYDKLREVAYELFLKAEHMYSHESKAGTSKMNYVVETIYQYIPTWLRIFVTYDLIKAMLQKWFTEIKDLLDDGKNNNSAELKI